MPGVLIVYKLFILHRRIRNNSGYNKNCKQKKEVSPMGRCNTNPIAAKAARAV